MALNQTVLQDIKKSFKDVHLDVKIYWIPPAHYEIPQLSSHYWVSSLKRIAQEDNLGGWVALRFWLA